MSWRFVRKSGIVSEALEYVWSIYVCVCVSLTVLQIGTTKSVLAKFMVVTGNGVWGQIYSSFGICFLNKYIYSYIWELFLI